MRMLDVAEFSEKILACVSVHWLDLCSLQSASLPAVAVANCDPQLRACAQDD